MSRRLAWVTCALCLLAAGCIEDRPAAPTCDRWSVGDGTYCTPGGARGIHETGFRCVDWPPGFACPADLPRCNDSEAGAFCADEALPPEEAERVGAAIAAARGDGADAEPAPDVGFDAQPPAPDDDAEMRSDAQPPDLDASPGGDAEPDDEVTDAMAGPGARAVGFDAYDPAFVPQASGVYLHLGWRARPAPNGEDELGVDLDLLLRHPNAGDDWTGEWVCSYRNSQPAWGDPGDAEDDPVLSIDEGHAGAEAIHYAAAAPGLRHGIAVDAYNLNERDAGPSPEPVTAWLAAFVDGAIVGHWQLRFTASSQRIWIGDIDPCDRRDESCEPVQGEPQLVPWRQGDVTPEP